MSEFANSMGLESVISVEATIPVGKESQKSKSDQCRIVRQLDDPS